MTVRVGDAFERLAELMLALVRRRERRAGEPARDDLADELPPTWYLT